MNWLLEAGRGKGPWAAGIRIGGAVIALTLAAGCATTGGDLTKDTPPEVKAAVVKERSNARWAALIKGDKDAAYAYLSPGTRELITVEQYRGKVQTGGFRSVQIDKVDCDSETCMVGLMLTYDYLPSKGVTQAKGVTTYVQETWVLEKGQAWFAWRP